MDESDLSASGINFDAPATFRKWPSLNGQRRIESAAAYLLLDGTLDECIRHFLAKPPPVRHLYEIHTSPQPPLVDAVVSQEIVAELARLHCSVGKRFLICNSEQSSHFMTRKN